MDQVSKQQFSDVNFDVKAWINAQMKQPLPEEGTATPGGTPAAVTPPSVNGQVSIAKYERRAAKLSQVLQAESTAVANSLDSAISQALTRLPRTEKEIERMVTETVSLSGQLEGIGEKTCATQTPHEHSQELQKLHHVHAKLRRCSTALAHAGEMAAQVDRIEHSIGRGFEGGMDADALAVEISKVDKALAALQETDPTFGKELRAKIDSFGAQLEQSLESACIDALRKRDIVKAPKLLATLHTIHRDAPVMDTYVEGLVEKKKNAFLSNLESASSSSVKATLASFHRDNAKFLKTEREYHTALASVRGPTATTPSSSSEVSVTAAGSIAAGGPSEVVKFQGKFLIRLYSGVGAKIEAKLIKAEDNETLVSSYEASGLASLLQATTGSTSSSIVADDAVPVAISTVAKSSGHCSGLETWFEIPEVVEEVGRPFLRLVDKPFHQREEVKLRAVVDNTLKLLPSLSSSTSTSVSSGGGTDTTEEESELDRSFNTVVLAVEAWCGRALRFLPDRSLVLAVRCWNTELDRLCAALLERVVVAGAATTVQGEKSSDDGFRQILSLNTRCITLAQLFKDLQTRLEAAAGPTRQAEAKSLWLKKALDSVAVLTEKSEQRLRQILIAPLDGKIQEYLQLPVWSGQSSSSSANAMVAAGGGYEAAPNGPCDVMRDAANSFMELHWELGERNVEAAQQQHLVNTAGAGFISHFIKEVRGVIFTKQNKGSEKKEGDKATAGPSSGDGGAPVKKAGSYAQQQLQQDIEYLVQVLQTVNLDDELRAQWIEQVNALLIE